MSQENNNLHCILNFQVKANLFHASKKYHVNLLLWRHSYELFWCFASNFSSLQFAGQGWVSPKGIVGCNPFLALWCLWRRNTWGVIPGVPAYLALFSVLASIESKRRADYSQNNPNQTDLLNILFPLFPPPSPFFLNLPFVVVCGTLVVIFCLFVLVWLLFSPSILSW